jgi:hypothetical protein
MGAPGLAFETWDPSNQLPLKTPIPLFVISSEADSSPQGATKVYLAREPVR